MKNSINVLIAPDSFKESLSAWEVCDAIASGIATPGYPLNIRKIPLADGGEGTLQSLVDAKAGFIVKIQARDPFMQQRESAYGIIDDGKTAVIEMARISGLEIVPKSERNPMLATTFGTGQLISDALNRGCRKFIIGIGGSATNDGGTGMLEALGVRFLKADGSPVSKGGGGLKDLHAIDEKDIDLRLNESEFSIACDVTNPLLGKQGATNTFARQKGATEEMVIQLEKNLTHYAKLLEEVFEKSIADVPGSGAAGGLGAGFLALPNSRLRSGFEIVKDTVALEENIRWSDLIFTGEGKTDAQTQYGKVPFGVGQLAKKRNIPVICLSGTHGEGTSPLLDSGITAIFSIIDSPMSLEEAMIHGRKLIEKSSEQIIRLYFIQNELFQ